MNLPTPFLIGSRVTICWDLTSTPAGWKTTVWKNIRNYYKIVIVGRKRNETKNEIICPPVPVLCSLYGNNHIHTQVNKEHTLCFISQSLTFSTFISFLFAISCMRSYSWCLHLFPFCFVLYMIFSSTHLGLTTLYTLHVITKWSLWVEMQWLIHYLTMQLKIYNYNTQYQKWPTNLKDATALLLLYLDHFSAIRE